MSNTATIPLPSTHETDLTLGVYAFHGLTPVKIFGRERDPKTGIVEKYWVVAGEGTKYETRYQVAANALKI
jgi:hypothetical protein